MVANNANSSVKIGRCWLGDEWRLAQALASQSIEWKIMGSCHPDWCMTYLIKSDWKQASLKVEAIWEVINVSSISREAVCPGGRIYGVVDASRHWGHVRVDPASWSQSQFCSAFWGRLFYRLLTCHERLLTAQGTPAGIPYKPRIQRSYRNNTAFAPLTNRLEQHWIESKSGLNMLTLHTSGIQK